MRMLMTGHAHHGSNHFFFLALEIFPFGFDSFDEHIEFFARLDLMAQRRTVTMKELQLKKKNVAFVIKKVKHYVRMSRRRSYFLPFDTKPKMALHVL
jgi:hypothetical protein